MKSKFLFLLFAGPALAQTPGFIQMSAGDLTSLDRTMNGLSTFNRDVAPALEVVTVVTGQRTTVETAPLRSQDACEASAAPLPRLRELPVLNRAPSRWQFSIETNFTAPRNRFTKEFLTQRTPALRQGLDALIAQRFDTHADRVSAMAQLCQGKSDAEILQLGSLLGGRLAQSYDNARAGGAGDQSFVSSEAQWDAMRTGSAAGVCRDSAMTLTEFLHACGVSYNRMKVEGYRSMSGGHQVVSIRGVDGKRYTINWSELYAQGEDAAVAPAPNPSILNTDIFYRSYDPKTGRLLEERRTELGEVLAAVTGGKVRHPNYFPDLIRLEATNGTISANVFQTNTQRGDFARGAAAYYQTSRADTFRGHVGIAVAVNERDVQISPTRGREQLSQALYYMNVGAEWEPVIPLARRPGLSIDGKPVVGIEVETYMSRNQLQGRGAEKNMNMMMTAYAGGSVEIQMGERNAVSLGGQQLMSVSRRPYNTEQADGSGAKFGVVPLGYSLTADGTVAVGPLNLTLNGERAVFSSEAYTTVGASVSDQNNRYRIGGYYAVYDRQDGDSDYRLPREVLVGFRGEAGFCFERVEGRVSAEVGRSLSSGGTFAGASLTLGGQRSVCRRSNE